MPPLQDAFMGFECCVPITGCCPCRPAQDERLLPRMISYSIYLTATSLNSLKYKVAALPANLGRGRSIWPSVAQGCRHVQKCLRDMSCLNNPKQCMQRDFDCTREPLTQTSASHAEVGCGLSNNLHIHIYPYSRTQTHMHDHESHRKFLRGSECAARGVCGVCGSGAMGDGSTRSVTTLTTSDSMRATWSCILAYRMRLQVQCEPARRGALITRRREPCPDSAAATCAQATCKASHRHRSAKPRLPSRLFVHTCMRTFLRKLGQHMGLHERAHSEACCRHYLQGACQHVYTVDMSRCALDAYQISFTRAAMP
jgi:hypothetical protein